MKFGSILLSFLDVEEADSVFLITTEEPVIISTQNIEGETSKEMFPADVNVWKSPKSTLVSVAAFEYDGAEMQQGMRFIPSFQTGRGVWPQQPAPVKMGLETIVQV